MPKSCINCPCRYGVYCAVKDERVDSIACDMARPSDCPIVAEIPDSPWHTGTPTEYGLYLVLWQNTEDNRQEYSVIYWHDHLHCWFDEKGGGLWSDEYHAKVVAWQKIEPYKGE